jgi:hypothetical protein
MSKATKTQAKAAYDRFHGILRCNNGGTSAENMRNAQYCYDRLTAHMPHVEALAANPSKRLREDSWLMEALTKSLPHSYKRFIERFPHVLIGGTDALESEHPGPFAEVDEDDPDRWEAEYNAKLNAAAPQMKEVCNLVVRRGMEQPSTAGARLTQDDWLLARSVVATAEGRAE